MKNPVMTLREFLTGAMYLTLLMAGPARADHELDWTDFDTHGQAIGVVNTDARVGKNTHAPIRVFANGGTQVDGIVALFHRATLDMSGGSINFEVDAMDRSTVAVSGGYIENGIIVRDRARAYVSGGEIGDLTVQDNGAGALFGGTVFEEFDTFDTSKGFILGGSIGEDVSAYFQSAIVIRGGTIGRNVIVRQDATIHLFGGSIGGDILSFNNGVVNVYGKNLRLSNPEPVFGGGFRYDLTGTLADGTPLNHSAYVLAAGRINLIDVRCRRPYFPLPGYLLSGHANPFFGRR